MHIYHLHLEKRPEQKGPLGTEAYFSHFPMFWIRLASSLPYFWILQSELDNDNCPQLVKIGPCQGLPELSISARQVAASINADDVGIGTRQSSYQDPQPFSGMHGCRHAQKRAFSFKCVPSGKKKVIKFSAMTTLPEIVLLLFFLWMKKKASRRG